jgi:cytochrome c-type biogenesis protein CcmH/NrfG
MEWRFTAGLVAMLALAAALNVGPLSRRLDVFVAERGLRHRIAESPRDSRAWYSLALVYQEVGREDEAETAYREVIRLAPSNAEALNNLAWLYVTAKDRRLYRPERALALAEAAVKLSPDAHVIDTLAEARFCTRDFAGALQAIEAALALNPPNRGYYLAQRLRFLQAFKRSG